LVTGLVKPPDGQTNSRPPCLKKSLTRSVKILHRLENS
jgi:hypothetical protein